MIKKVVVVLLTFLLASFSYAGYNIQNYLNIPYDKVYDLVHSSNSFAFRIKYNWQYYVIKDGEKSKAYSSISKLMYSNNWEIFLYKVRKDNGKYTLVVNWKELKGEYDRIYDIYLNSQGDWYAFIAWKNWKNVVVFNWNEIWTYEYVSYVTFTPDGKNVIVFFNEWNLSYVDYKWKKYWDWSNVLWVGFNWDELVLLTKKDDKYYINGVAYTIKDTAYSKYRNSFAILVDNNGNGVYVIKDGKKQSTFDNINSLTYFWNKLAYKASKNFKWALVIDWVVYPYYDNVYIPVYADNWDFVYLAEQSGKKLIIKNKNILGQYDNIDFYDISPSWKVVYIVDNKVFIDGNEIWTYNGVSKVSFLKNNGVWFLYTKDKKNYVYVEWNIYWPYLGLSPLAAWFSKVAYLVSSKLYENGSYISNFTDIKDSFYIKDNLVIYWKNNWKLWIFYISPSTTTDKLSSNKTISDYIDQQLKEKYKALIIEKFWKKIFKVSYQKRKKVAPMVDKIVEKIIINPKYDESTKIRKVSLFMAFKEVLLEY